MTNIAAVIFSDAGTPPTETTPPATGVSDQAFDEVLAGVVTNAPVAPSAETPTGILPNPAALLSTIPTLLPGGELSVADGELAECVGKEDAEVTDDADSDQTPPPAPEDDVTVLSSCLAMWQILPPPAPQPLLVSAGDEISAIEIGIGNSAPANEGVDDRSLPEAPTGLNTDAAPAPRTADKSLLRAGISIAAPEPKEMPAPPISTGTSPVQIEAAAAPADAPVATTVVSKENAATVPHAAHAAPAPHAAEPVKIRPLRAASAKAQTPSAVGDGIPVAKEHRVMRDPVFQPSPKIAPAAFAEGETPVKATPEAVVEMAHSGASADGSALEDQGQDGMSGDHREPAMTEFVMPTSGRGIHPGAEAGERDPKTVASEATQVIQHIERTVERMRTGERVEMRVPLQDGGEVVVKLRMEHGEVKAIFQSSAEGLQHALETGWAQRGQNLAERADKITSTVFQSSSTQSGTGGFSQSSDQRERNERSRYPEADFTPLPHQPENRKAHEVRRPSGAGTQAASLQIYA